MKFNFSLTLPVMKRLPIALLLTIVLTQVFIIPFSYFFNAPILFFPPLTFIPITIFWILLGLIVFFTDKQIILFPIFLFLIILQTWFYYDFFKTLPYKPIDYLVFFNVVYIEKDIPWKFARDIKFSEILTYNLSFLMNYPIFIKIMTYKNFKLKSE